MADQVRSRNERADSLVRNYGDDSRSEVVIDGSGNILVAASSQSALRVLRRRIPLVEDGQEAGARERRTDLAQP